MMVITSNKFPRITTKLINLLKKLWIMVITSFFTDNYEIILFVFLKMT